MANRFSIEPPNPLQALMLGQQSYDSARQRGKQADMEAGRQEAVQALQGGGDTRGALAKLIGIGDIQGANAIASYAQQQASQGHQAAALAESARHNRAAEGFQQQQFGLAQQQAKDAARGFEYKEVDDGNGGKALVRIEKATGAVSRPEISGVSQEPASPYAPTGRLTADQAKDRSYVGRMVASHDIINGLENINDGVGGWVGGTAAANSRVRDSSLFNTSASPERQKSIQAQRNFVNATLRRESGAAVSASEFENAQRQYFPMPGDSKEVLAQKRQNRMQTIEGMMQGAGPGYKPPSNYVGTKGAAQPAKPGDQKVIDYRTYFGGGQ